MANAATNSPPGTVIDMENLRTESTAAAEERTRRRIRAGLVGSATAQTSSTPDRSSLLSADETRTLARIAQDRRSGFMVSGPDVDFLLEVITRLTL